MPAEASAAEPSLYAALGVGRDASVAEIRKAYRKQALINHPDKNAGDDNAQERFLKVAVAYDILSDETKRARYDRGEQSAAEIYGGFTSGRASDMFNAQLGKELMEQWRSGLTVRGTVVTNGRRVSIVIHPDGSTQETEHPANRLACLFYYSHMSITYAGGNRTHHMNFRTQIGQNLAARLVPFAIARLPLVGPATTTAVSWVPTVCAGVLSYALVRHFRQFRAPPNPGALPDILAGAFTETGGLMPPGLAARAPPEYKV